MKSCPTCQQLYSDALEICPNDGSTLLSSSLGYSPGSSTYKWQSGQLPPNQANWQQQQQQQQPPPGWGYYPPPTAYPPYGYGAPYAPQPAAGGEGLATASLWTGISTAACIAFGFLLIATATRTYYTTDYGTRYSGPSGAAAFGAILIFLSYIVGLTALILGIVAASMASRNPAISKSKAIVGLCLGAIPYLLLIVGLVAGASWGRW